MNFWQQWFSRKKKWEQDLNEELRFHIEQQTAANIAAGMPHQEARRQAMLQLGAIEGVKEYCREERRAFWLESLWTDVRYGARMLRKSPGFTIVAILTLALGIGANAAIFSAVDSILLKPLPYPEAAKLIEMKTRNHRFSGPSVSEFTFIRNHTVTLSSAAAYCTVVGTMAGADNPERIWPTMVSGEFFPLFDVPSLYGRELGPSDVTSGNDVVVLSYSAWRASFGSDSHVLGRTITLDRKPYVVVGVMPPQFDYPPNPVMWLPLIPADARKMHASSTVSVVARIKSGSSKQEVQAELDTLAAQLEKARFAKDRPLDLYAVFAKEDMVSGARLALLVLFGAVGFVLLIACANIGNLSLSRGWSRRQELAIRSSLGAPTSRIVRQLLIENMLLSLLGGALAFLLARWGVTALRALLPYDTPRVGELRADSSTFFLTLGISLAAGFLFGLAPAFILAKQALHEAVGTGERPSNSHFSSAVPRFRHFLVVVEIALALILLSGATLALRSLSNLLNLSYGFQTDHLLTMRLHIPDYKSNESYDSGFFTQQLLEELQALPGVEAASVEDDVRTNPLYIEGASNGPSDNPMGQVNLTFGSSDYFRTFRIPLLAGREFTPADRVGVSPVAIVNETFAKEFFPGRDPIGKRVAMDLDVHKKPIYSEIVGEVGDIRNQSTPWRRPIPAVYRPFFQQPSFGGGDYAIRTSTDPKTLVPAIRSVVWSIAEDQPITSLQTVDDTIDAATASPRSQTILLGTFAGLGLLLAVMGIYGVISYFVVQRTHEIGVRMALGARPGDVMRLVVGQGARLALLGIAFGIAGALGVTRFLQSMLFEVKPTDPLTFTGVAILLLLVALLACYIPARRAMRVDPMVSLRHE